MTPERFDVEHLLSDRPLGLGEIQLGFGKGVGGTAIFRWVLQARTTNSSGLRSQMRVVTRKR